jgi:hypothetical protein
MTFHLLENGTFFPPIFFLSIFYSKFCFWDWQVSQIFFPSIFQKNIFFSKFFFKFSPQYFPAIFSQIFYRAVKIEFDIIERQWIETTVEINISTNSFSQGGMRMAFKGTLIENGTEFNIVAKTPKPDKKYPQEMFYQVILLFFNLKFFQLGIF